MRGAFSYNSRPCLYCWIGAMFLLLATPNVISAQSRVRSTDSTFLLEAGRAGPFSVGMTVEELYRVVGRGPLTLVDLFGEGVFTPAVLVRLVGGEDRPSIVAHLGRLQCQRFWRWYLPSLEIRDERFRTRDGLGVGSMFTELREHGWVTAEGQAGARAHHDEVPHFATIRFIFEGREGECEGCGAPGDDARAVAVRLAEPYPRMRERRCAELEP